MSFRAEFEDVLRDGVVSEIQVGLGPAGELRYPRTRRPMAGSSRA